MESSDKDPIEQTRMTLGEHLEELRVRLIRGCVALVVIFSVSWFFKEQVAEIVLAPAQEKAIPWLNELIFERAIEELVEEGLPDEEQLADVFTEGPWLEELTARLAEVEQAAAQDESRREAGGLPTLEELTAVFQEGIVKPRHLENGIRNQLRSDAFAGGFVFFLKVCFYAALFLGGPFLIWQMWAFIAAGLYRNEKGYVYRYAPFSMALFLSGVVFGYLYMVPYAQYFLAEMGIGTFHYDFRLELYLSFFTKLSLGLGIVFQLPILMLGLTRAGITEPQHFSRYRGHFWIGALVVAAILTPPDPYTQMMMAGPMALLYELGLLLARIGYRRAKAGAEVPVA
jgi:sec-independent protein translocase protein TatC